MPGRGSLKRFVNGDSIWHEVVVIAISYIFVLAGAWNDDLLGFAPSLGSHILEIAMAIVLAAEIAIRIALTENRTLGYYIILALDAVSLLTVFPFLAGVALARLIRMLYAAWRLTRLLDKLAVHKKNPMYLTALFPFGVPLFAAVVYALERHAAGSQIHNYGQALLVCLAFALSLGNIRPTSPISMALCGILFLAGIVCIGIVTNWISNRYQRPAAR